MRLVVPGRPFLGVTTRTASGDVKGAEVTRVRRGTPARRAGIAEGEIITQFAGEPVNSPTDLARLVRDRRAGEVVTLQVWRSGKSEDVTLQLGSKPR